MSSDMATDGGREICAAWAERDRRFRLVENGKRLGMTANWNRALRECRGEYVVKLDADDVMRSRFLEVLLEALRADVDRIAVFCRTLDCDGALEPQSSYLGERAFWAKGIDPLRMHVKPGREWLRLCFDGYQLWHSNAFMLRRVFLESLGGWDDRWGCAPDTDLILRILETGGRVVHHPYCGIWYRRRQGSVSQIYEIMGWKAVEGLAIHMRSLLRQRRSGQPLDWESLRAWCRYWAGWRAVARRLDSGDGAGLPPGLRDTTITALTSEVAPSRGLRTILWVRTALSGVVRHVRSILWRVGHHEVAVVGEKESATACASDVKVRVGR